MRVAVFRAEADGRRTARRLEARGHSAVVAPMLRIIATGAMPDVANTAGVIFTSAHAAELLSSAVAKRLQIMPCWCVGQHTAGAARAAGFHDILTGPGDATALADLIRSRQHDGPLLLLTARDRKPAIERALQDAEIPYRVVEVYKAETADTWPAATVADLSGCDAALHFSRRSADLALDRLADSELADNSCRWLHACLSLDIAEAATSRGCPNVAVAEHPTEEALIRVVGT